MTTLNVGLLLMVLAALAMAAAGAAPGATPTRKGDLVRNGCFREAGAADVPAEWTAWEALWQPARCRMRRTRAGLLIDAPAGGVAVGGAYQDLAGIEQGKAYAVEARCRVRKVASPQRTALVRLTWMHRGKLLHPAGFFVAGPDANGQELTFRDVLVVPQGADGARLSLEVKWPGAGSVLWRSVSVRPAPLPKPRTVRIGTVYLRPKDSTPEKNLRLWCRKIDQAGKLKLDVVCLCEAITQVGTASTSADVAEAIPGPSTKVLGAAARRNKLYVVAGLMERDGETLYNTAVLLDRRGRLVGKYRKVHLPREEWRTGVAPGGNWPVFQTDFGKVAIQICYDWFFPEAAAIFALRGAEVLFAPTWGTTFPDKAGRVEGETVFRVRARDNGLYMVPSVYDGSSMVIDPLGRIVATSNGEKEGVYWAEVDLSRRRRLWWVGHWRSIGPRHRMPEAYGPLTEP